MARIAWVFTDLATADSYVWPINPNDGGSPQYLKTINYQNTAAPDGKTLIFEGRDEPATASFSGVLLTEEQYNALYDWWKKRHQVQIEDDLGRKFVIYITKFQPKRERSRTHPWKHTYTCEYVILDWE